MERPMIDLRLAVAAGLLAALAFAHSWLGERIILQPLLASRFDVGGPRRSAFIRRTLRFAWHLTSLFMLGFGGILAALAGAAPERAGVFILEVAGATFIVSAAITFSASKGRHPAWLPLLIAGALSWWTAGRYDGSDAFAATTAPIGLIVAAILLAAAALHAYWAASGFVAAAAVPQRNGAPVFTPGRIATGGVALVLLAASLLVAQQALGVADWPSRGLVKAGCWALAAVFIVRAIGDFRWVGLFKRVNDTPFALCDTAAYTPLCLMLGLAIAAIVV
jgi:hypothetical protein